MSASKRRNILLIVADCARSDKWLGASRSTRTPNFDRFAESAAVLPTTIVEKSCTTPSFSTLLTSRYSPRHGVHLVWGYRLPASVPMLTESLAAAGYHTYAEVSGPLLPEMGLSRGFQKYEYRAPCDYLHTPWGDRFVQQLRSGVYREPWFILLHLWELHPHRCVPAAFDAAEFGRDSYERAISALDAQLPRLFQAAGDDAIIAFTGDHGEKTTAEEYLPGTAVDYSRGLLGVDKAEGIAPYQIAAWAGPSVLQGIYGQSAPLVSRLRLRDMPRRPRFDWWSRTRDRLRLLWVTPWLYLHDLLALGAPLRLTQMLKRRGLLDENTARGKVERFARAVGKQNMLDMHLRMWINSYKHNLHEGHLVHVYDYLVRVPLVIRAPGILPAGLQSPRMVRQPDILPTLLDLAGVPAAADELRDGRSLLPLLRGEPWEAAPAYLSVSGTPLDLELRGVRTETHKLTFGPHNDEMPVELYDLLADPAERSNIAAREPRLVGELRSLADQIAARGRLAAVDEMELSAEDEKKVAAQLRALGYVE